MLLNKNNEMNTEPIRQDKSKAKIAQLLVKQDSQLLNFLIQELKGKSRTTVKSLLAHRQVSLGAQPVTQFDFPLKKGQTVTINWGKVSEQVRLRGLRILFEDPYIIVVEKAAGILSIATAKEKLLTAYSILSDYVKRDNPENRIFVIHRLDRDTSGVMMFARSEEIQSVLQRAWQDMVVERTYSAIVEGQVESDEGTIRSYLKENKALIMYSTKNPGEGDEAITHYTVVKRTENYTLVDLELETGRKNQIRVHMKDLGHSIVGDRKYGSKQNPIRRIALHARVLEFVHPVTRQTLRFETLLPPPFNYLLKEDDKS